MGMTFSTYPVFAKMAEDPQLRYAVKPLLRRYAGLGAIEELEVRRQGLLAEGMSPRKASLSSLAMVLSAQDEKVFSLQSKLAGFDDVLKNIGRGAAAVATGGASEIAINKDLRDKLKKASSKSWDAFAKSVKDAVKGLKNIKDIQDVMNIVKLAATGGLSLVGDASMNAINEFLFELLDPLLNKIATTIGSSYANGKAAVVRGVKKAFKNSTEVVRKIVLEVVQAAYDLVLGFPLCMCEEGCIKPIATILAKVSNPYVKIVGQIMKVLYPIIQGQNASLYASSSAVAFYSGSKHGKGIDLIPKPKLPEDLERTVGRVLDAIDSDYAMGMPMSYLRYRGWIVDKVARGYRGPRVVGGVHDARYYFENPEEALSVLADADKLSGIWDSVKKYVKFVDRALQYGQKAYDLYEAAKRQDFSFDPRSWEAEDLKEYVASSAESLEKFAGKAKEALSSGSLTRWGKKKVASNITKMTNVESKAKAFKKSKPQMKILPTLTSKGGSSIHEKLLKAGALGAVSKALAVAGEWQAAELGLTARAQWCEMATKWLDMSEKDRQAWTTYTSGWREKAIDYPAWKKLLEKDQNLNEMILAKQLHEVPAEQFAAFAAYSKQKKTGATKVIKDVANARGLSLGISDLYRTILEGQEAIETASATITPTRILTLRAKGLTDAQISDEVKKEAEKAREVPKQLTEAVVLSGLSERNWTPTLIAAGTAVAAIAVAASLKR